MQLALYLESLAEEVTRGQLGGEDVAELQDEREQVEALLEGRLAEIDSIEVRIIPLENEIAEAREEIEILEEILDELPSTQVRGPVRAAVNAKYEAAQAEGRV